MTRTHDDTVGLTVGRIVKVWHHAGRTARKHAKVSWTLLLPIFLVFAQQGELRHEYSHYAEQATSRKKAPADADHCLECLAFAQIAGAAKADVGKAILLTGLAFHFARSFAIASVGVEAAAPRSRGPPAL